MGCVHTSARSRRAWRSSAAAIAGVRRLVASHDRARRNSWSEANVELCESVPASQPASQPASRPASQPDGGEQCQRRSHCDPKWIECDGLGRGVTCRGMQVVSQLDPAHPWLQPAASHEHLVDRKRLWRALGSVVWTLLPAGCSLLAVHSILRTSPPDAGRQYDSGARPPRACVPRPPVHRPLHKSTRPISAASSHRTF